MTTTTFSAATFHSLDRAKERVGVKGKQAEKMIRLAVERGKGAECFTSQEKRYLEIASSKGENAVAYNNFCYIINEYGMCITMYPLPGWFGKKKRFDGKKKIRDLKKYSRNYDLWPSFAM